VGRGFAKTAKRTVAGVVFVLMGRGMVACARLDDRVHAEVSAWPEGTVVTLAIAPAGPRVSVQVAGGRLRTLGGRAGVEPTLLVTFKSADAALPVLLGLSAILAGFAEHRATVRGDLALAMSLVRCLHIVEGYLYPDLMTRRILPRPARRQAGHLRAYLALLSASTALAGKGRQP
jgi:hypothetical protein